jgi:hypothetical protein
MDADPRFCADYAGDDADDTGVTRKRDTSTTRK